LHPLQIDSYDDICQLLEQIENDELEDRCSDADLEKINHFLVSLAKEGVNLENTEEVHALDHAISSLFLKKDQRFQIAYHWMTVNEDCELEFCKSWVSKQWKQTKKFVKHHKKEIIIGAAVVAVAAIVICALLPASTAVAAGAGSIGVFTDSEKIDTGSIDKGVISEELDEFKSTILQNDLFDNLDPDFPIEENGKIVGQIFGKRVVENVADKSRGYLSDFEENAHRNIEKQFKLADHFSRSEQPLADFHFLRAEKALERNCYSQALADYDSTLALKPDQYDAHLGKSVTHLKMGNHEYAADSFEQYIVSKPSSLENIKKFSSNFIEGFVRGAKESVVGLVHFGKDCILHPINTVKEIYEVCSILHSLVRTNEWKTIGKALSPEVYELITNWEELQLEKRVELSGFAVGKYGTDVFAPGTLLKVGKSAIHDGKIIANLAKHLSASEKLLLIEAGIDSGALSKAAKFENQSFYKQINSKRIISFDEEPGFIVQKANHYKQSGRLEAAVNNELEKLVPQSKSEVYKAAIRQNKHVKMVRDYLDKPTKEIQKGINSYEKQVALHKDKISNPLKHYSDWNKLDPRQREALINKKWPTEIQIYEEQKKVLQSILNERIAYE